MRIYFLAILSILSILALAACGTPATETVYLTSSGDGLVGCDTDAMTPDSSDDATIDEAGDDAGDATIADADDGSDAQDAGPDVVDASPDASPDAADSGIDAGPDSGADAGADAGPDAGVDSGADAGLPECTQTAGTWANVTPAGVSMSPGSPTPGGVDPGGNYGAQDVLVDPVNANTLYAFLCHQGVWKSVDYGCTWSLVSTGANSAHLLTGRPWTAAIDPSTTRSPSAAPALYTVSGDGDLLGVYVSTNGGVDWANYPIGNTTARFGGADDAYALDVDPTNSAHLITGMHDEGMSESLNGGMTWRTVPVPGAFGLSVYPFFVRGASPPSTTWITQAQWDSNTQGMWRTVNSGATWTHVNTKLEHDHGSSQIYQNGAGMIEASGETGGSNPINRSLDFGATWKAVDDGSIVQNSVFGTPTSLYATRPFADNAGIGQHFQKASLAGDAGATWVDWTPTAPISNGAKRISVTNDGHHNVFVGGFWNAGLWRYVEP